jgi:2-oxoglutarate ferredoxin oxidoreductase subunit alpha
MYSNRQITDKPIQSIKSDGLYYNWYIDTGSYRQWVLDREIPEEERAVLYDSGDSDFLIVGWGFVKGVALDALEELESRGLKGAYLHLRMFQPFPTRLVERILSNYDPSRVIAVEHNYMAQAAKVVAMNTGFRIRKEVLKWTGRPIYLMELVSAIVEVLEGGRDRVVLRYGE